MAVVALNDIWIVANYKETQLKNVRSARGSNIKWIHIPAGFLPVKWIV